MAYVRQRGNQLALVRGVRDAATGMVEQQILLTLYSKEEARAAIGPEAARLRRLLRERFAGVKLGWDAITKQISEKLESLPDHHERRDDRNRSRLRESMVEFTRQLGLADPQNMSSAAELISQNEHELRFVRDLIDWRLQVRKAPKSEFSDDLYGWRLSLPRQEIPTDVEGLASALLERGNYREAHAAFHLLIDAFGDDPDACNYLGLIALEDDDLAEACARFEQASVIARRSFPRKVAKRSFGKTLETRPYVRALRNLALAQNQAGLYEAALATCARLEKECGDRFTAESHRASVALNVGDYELAWKAACYGRELAPAESFVGAFAAHELGRTEDAVASFLHGALWNRRAARMLLGESTPEPENYAEQEEHNAGVYLVRAIRAYLRTRGKGAVRAFKKLKATPAVAELLSEMEAVVRRWRGDNKTAGWKQAFDRMTEMKKLAFAREQARGILAAKESAE